MLSEVVFISYTYSSIIIIIITLAVAGWAFRISKHQFGLGRWPRKLMWSSADSIILWAAATQSHASPPASWMFPQKKKKGKNPASWPFGGHMHMHIWPLLPICTHQHWFLRCKIFHIILCKPIVNNEAWKSSESYFKSSSPATLHTPTLWFLRCIIQ